MERFYMDVSTLFSGQGYAEDYYLDAKSQCAGARGACPDKNIPRGKNDVRLLNSAIINDFTMLTYRFLEKRFSLKKFLGSDQILNLSDSLYRTPKIPVTTTLSTPTEVSQSFGPSAL